MSKHGKNNDAIYERLVRLRSENPKRFYLTAISTYWDELNNEFQNNGISETFVLKRKLLKSRIRFYIDEIHVLSEDDLKAFCLEHPDHKNPANGKSVHGYNFKY